MLEYFLAKCLFTFNSFSLLREVD